MEFSKYKRWYVAQRFKVPFDFFYWHFIILSIDILKCIVRFITKYFIFFGETISGITAF